MNYRVGGIILLAAGVLLLLIGLSASDSIADQMSNFFTGTFTDRTMWYIVGGAVLAIIGLSILLVNRMWSRY